MKKLQVDLSVPTQITMTRVFDAPKHLVVKAMSEPALIKQWLGNSRSPIIACEVDHRVGGTYRYAFRTPDGHEFALHGTFKELGPDRVVNTEGMEGMPGESDDTTTWTEANGKTTMTVTMVFPNQEIRDIVANTGMADGAGESYDNLESLVRAQL